MKDLNDKATGSTLTASEFNEIPSEIQQAITDSGQTLSSGDLTQLSKATSANVANKAAAVLLTPINNKSYFIGGSDGGWFKGVTGGSGYADNGGSYCGTQFIPTGGDGSAAWVRVYDDSINIVWFGAIAGADSTTAIKNTVSAAIANTKIKIPSASSSYLMNEKLSVNVRGIVFDGDTPEGSVIEFNNSLDAGIEFSTDDSNYTDYTGTAADYGFNNIRIKGPGKATSTTGIMDWENGGALLSNVIISHFGTGFEGVSGDVCEWIKVSIHNCTDAGFIAGPSDQFTMVAPYIFSNTRGLTLEYPKAVEMISPKFVFNTDSDLIISTPDAPKYAGYSSNNSHVIIRNPWLESSANKSNFFHIGKSANTISAQGVVISDPIIITSHTITAFCEIDGATDVKIIRPNIANQTTGTITNLILNNTFGSVIKHVELIEPRGKLTAVTNLVGGADKKVSIIYSKDGISDVQGVEYDGIGYRFKPDSSGAVIDIQSLNSGTWATILTLDGGNKEIKIPTGGYTLKTASSLWSNEPFALGNYYLWVDATGDLRIKSGAPTSDTDGTVVGTQT